MRVYINRMIENVSRSDPNMAIKIYNLSGLSKIPISILEYESKCKISTEEN
jgi:hypothetical protein